METGERGGVVGDRAGSSQTQSSSKQGQGQVTVLTPPPSEIGRGAPFSAVGSTSLALAVWEEYSTGGVNARLQRTPPRVTSTGLAGVLLLIRDGFHGKSR
jgi:hypothetical protein